MSLRPEVARPSKVCKLRPVFETVWRIRDVYSGFRILFFTHPASRISDPKTAIKERGEKNLFVITFYAATNFSKLQIILDLEC
jgi:hypothetical protein